MMDTIILVGLGLFILAMICSIIRLIMKIKAFQIEDADRPAYADSNHSAESKASARKGKSFFGWTDQEEEEEEEEEVRAERPRPSKDRRRSQSKPANHKADADPRKPSVVHSGTNASARSYEREPKETPVSQFLLCLPESSRTIPLKEGKQYICGRSEECDLVFSLPFVSRQHCLLEVEGGNVYLYDKQSTNGIEVNGAKIRRGIQLNSGDTVGVNQHVLFCIQIQKPRLYLGENHI